MIQPNNYKNLKFSELEVYRKFSDITECMSKLVDMFTSNSTSNNISEINPLSQYQFGIGTLDSNNFEWYKFLNFLNNRENLDYFGHNSNLLWDLQHAHKPTAVVQYIPYMIPLYSSRIHDHQISMSYRRAYLHIYQKFSELKNNEKRSVEDIFQIVFSPEWIRETIYECVLDYQEINYRNVSIFARCNTNDDGSKIANIQILIDGVSLKNVKRLHTIVNALYNAYFNIIDELHRLNEILKFYGTVQLQVARTVISIDDVREQIEHMQSDLQKIFRYFTANATPYELSKILDICLEVAVADNILALLNTAPYRVMSAFCKLLHSKRFSPYTFKHSPAYNSIELPRLHYGFSKSEFCEEIQKSKYYQDFRTKYDDVLTVENFVAHINNDKSYCFKIDVFSCSERDDENNIIQQYPHIFRFHLRSDRDFVGLEALQDVVAQYFAIVEYFNARYGLVEFYCYGDCMFTKSDSKSNEPKQTELAEINRALFKTFEECKEAGRISSFMELIMNDNKPINSGDQTNYEKEESSESSEETNPDTNPF